jgi:bifunctional DNA-binding transcriptional regulator/antitoxin component of YhaV-PrlF toxin-antitoxin module
MTVTVRNRTKTPLVVPPSVRREAGHKNGEDLEFRVSGGVITILPKLPAADGEYTPEQRRIIDARLAKNLADIKDGRTYGPFETHREMIDFLHVDFHRTRMQITSPLPRTSARRSTNK